MAVAFRKHPKQLPTRNLVVQLITCVISRRFDLTCIKYLKDRDVHPLRSDRGPQNQWSKGCQNASKTWSPRLSFIPSPTTFLPHLPRDLTRPQLMSRRIRLVKGFEIATSASNAGTSSGTRERGVVGSGPSHPAFNRVEDLKITQLEEVPTPLSLKTHELTNPTGSPSAEEGFHKTQWAAPRIRCCGYCRGEAPQGISRRPRTVTRQNSRSGDPRPGR